MRRIVLLVGIVTALIAFVVTTKTYAQKRTNTLSNVSVIVAGQSKSLNLKSN